MTIPSAPVPDLVADSDPHTLSSRFTVSSDVSSSYTSFTSASSGDINRLQVGTEEAKGTSLHVFHRWLNEDGMIIDASKVVSKACFDDWCTGRSSQSSGGLCRTFQRVLKCHVTGSEGRQPFQHDEEAAILKEIRKKQIWPAFEDTDMTIGCRGFRGHGYHEMQQTFISSSKNESLMQQQQVAARCAVDPALSKADHTAYKDKRGAAEMALPQNKVFKQAEMVYSSIPQQYWMHTPSTLPAANTYSHPNDVMLQNQRPFSPLLGMHNQPLVVPNGYFKPMTFHLCHILSQQTVVHDNGQPYG